MSRHILDEDLCISELETCISVIPDTFKSGQNRPLGITRQIAGLILADTDQLHQVSLVPAISLVRRPVSDTDLVEGLTSVRLLEPHAVENGRLGRIEALPIACGTPVTTQNTIDGRSPLPATFTALEETPNGRVDEPFKHPNLAVVNFMNPHLNGLMIETLTGTVRATVSFGQVIAAGHPSVAALDALDGDGLSESKVGTDDTNAIADLRLYIIDGCDTTTIKAPFAVGLIAEQVPSIRIPGMTTIDARNRNGGMNASVLSLDNNAATKPLGNSIDERRVR